jgi:hypothetical protein
METLSKSNGLGRTSEEGGDQFDTGLGRNGDQTKLTLRLFRLSQRRSRNSKEEKGRLFLHTPSFWDK